MTHGTPTAYRKSCRCIECRTANMAYLRAYRASYPEKTRAYGRRYRQRNLEKEKARDQARVWPQGRQVRLSHNPRTGVCQRCGRKIGEGIKRTNMHHERYDPADALAHTIELCVACHNQRHAA